MSLLNCRINQHQLGDPKESLKYESVSLEALEQGKVRVEVEATNINPSDLLSIYGVGQYKKNHVPPRVPGFEAVGRVRQSHSSEFLEGDRVVVATSGTWQRYVDVEPNNLFHVPEHLEAGFASQLYINSLTAWVLTQEVAALTNDDCLIINAGNSAIGKIFAQLSQSLGFTLIVVTSSPDRNRHKTPYVVHTNEDFVEQIRKLGAPLPNVAFDAIGGTAGEKLLNTLKDAGRFINYGTLSLELYQPSFFQSAKRANVEFRTFFLRYWEDGVGSQVRRNAFESMLKHFLSNDIALDVDRSMCFSDYLQAIELIESNKPLEGKIILIPF